LVRVKKRAYLGICVLADVHHFGAAVLLRKRRVLVEALHLSLLGLEDLLQFGLLIGREVKLLGEFLGALGWILMAVMPPATFLRGLGLLVVRWTILGPSRRGNGEGAGCNEDKQVFLKQVGLKHGISF
jgi:hypothetical protein